MAVTSEMIETIYRAEGRRVLASLIRLLGGFDLAEEALHEAFLAASVQWPKQGLPDNPRTWLVSAGRFKGIDRIRQRARLSAAVSAQLAQLGPDAEVGELEDEETLVDDQLRLIFTCCHPILAPDAQVALTLREVCRLSTEEVARAFLVAPTTVAQRIVRAKARIRDAKIPYEVPDSDALPERLELVLQVIYLVFNEGYAPSAGTSVTRADVSAEAIRLGRLVANLLPDAEVLGLLALMLLQEARRAARMTDSGDIVLLADQDRGKWNAGMTAEGLAMLDQALEAPEIGHFTLQAAIAAVHAQARRAADTDWAEIVALYDRLVLADPGPVVALNRAVAISMRDGAAAGLSALDAALASGALENYHLAHAARADLLRQLGQKSAAITAYQRALALAQQEPERRFLAMRLSELGVD